MYRIADHSHRDKYGRTCRWIENEDGRIRGALVNLPKTCEDRVLVNLWDRGTDGRGLVTRHATRKAAVAYIATVNASVTA